MPSLIGALKDKSTYVCKEAAKALGKLGDKKAVPALIEALNNENGYLRQVAAMALSKIGNKKTVPILLTKLNFLKSNDPGSIPDDVFIFITIDNLFPVYEIFNKISEWNCYHDMSLYCLNAISNNCAFDDKGIDILKKSEKPCIRASGYFLEALK